MHSSVKYTIHTQTKRRLVLNPISVRLYWCDSRKTMEIWRQLVACFIPAVYSAGLITLWWAVMSQFSFPSVKQQQIITQETVLNQVQWKPVGLFHSLQSWTNTWSTRQTKQPLWPFSIDLFWRKKSQSASLPALIPILQHHFISISAYTTEKEQISFGSDKQANILSDFKRLRKVLLVIIHYWTSGKHIWACEGQFEDFLFCTSVYSTKE